MRRLISLLIVLLPACSEQKDSLSKSPPSSNASRLSNPTDIDSLPIERCLQQKVDKKRCHFSNQAYEYSMVGSYSNSSSSIPYISVRNIHGMNRIKSVFIYIEGGPLGDFKTKNQYNALALYPRQEELVIYPIYFGMQYASLFPDSSDVSISVNRISELIDNLSDHYPNADMTVIGESFGTIISSRLRLPKSTKSIFLSAPFGYTGTTLLKYFNDHTSIQRKSIDSVNTFVVRKNGHQMILLSEYSKLIYQKIGDKNLLDIKAIKNHGCSFLIYGSLDPILKERDPRINLSDIFTGTYSFSNRGHNIFRDLNGKDDQVAENWLRSAHCPH